MNSIKIRKAERILGKTLIMRNATVTDAAFILSLRMDANKSRYLSKVTGELIDQKKWLQNYSECEDEAYFIIENLQGIPIGTLRLYDAQGDSFCCGSWILTEAAPLAAAMESALIGYHYALNSLGFLNAHFRVHKSNQSVCKFHERFGANRVSEDLLQYTYKLSNSAIKLAMDKYRRYLPDGIFVENMSK